MLLLVLHKDALFQRLHHWADINRLVGPVWNSLGGCMNVEIFFCAIKRYILNLFYAGPVMQHPKHLLKSSIPKEPVA
jgi:hypothetical protein